jgi:hypothetical protein
MLALSLLALALMVVLFLRIRERSVVEAAAWQARLAERDAMINGLRRDIANVRAFVEAMGDGRPNPRTTAPTAADRELRRQAARLSMLQSNTQEVIEQLRGASKTAEEPGAGSGTGEASQTALEDLIHETLEDLEEANQRTAQLRASLDVPEEVAGMDPDTALELERWRDYWPYFEAAKDRDNLQRIATALQRRLTDSESAGDP